MKTFLNNRIIEPKSRQSNFNEMKSGQNCVLYNINEVNGVTKCLYL